MTNYKIKRIRINDEDLAQVVGTVLRAKTANNETFSAHDVTDDVRVVLGQAVEVQHDRVKSLVHQGMNACPGYLATDNGTYIEYQPANTTGYSFVFDDDETPQLNISYNPWYQVTMSSVEEFYPDSTVIQSMRYEKATQQLKIVFHSGPKEYTYFNVPESVWIAFKNATSQGRYFHTYIKGQYQEI